MEAPFSLKSKYAYNVAVALLQGSDYRHEFQSSRWARENPNEEVMRYWENIFAFVPVVKTSFRSSKIILPFPRGPPLASESLYASLFRTLSKPRTRELILYSPSRKVLQYLASHFDMKGFTGSLKILSHENRELTCRFDKRDDGKTLKVSGAYFWIQQFYCVTTATSIQERHDTFELFRRLKGDMVLDVELVVHNDDEFGVVHRFFSRLREEGAGSVSLMVRVETIAFLYRVLTSNVPMVVNVAGVDLTKNESQTVTDMIRSSTHLSEVGVIEPQGSPQHSMILAIIAGLDRNVSLRKLNFNQRNEAPPAPPAAVSALLRDILPQNQSLEELGLSSVLARSFGWTAPKPGEGSEEWADLWDGVVENTSLLRLWGPEGRGGGFFGPRRVRDWRRKDAKAGGLGGALDESSFFDLLSTFNRYEGTCHVSNPFRDPSSDWVDCNLSAVYTLVRGYLTGYNPSFVNYGQNHATEDIFSSS